MTTPIGQLDRVHARDDGGRGGKPRGRITGVSVALDAGVWAFVGAIEDGTLALAQVCAGRRRPRSGRLRIGNRRPAHRQ